jgi:hypothetical protein
MESDAKQLAHQLAYTGATERAVELGDPFLLGAEFRSISESEVANTFGGNFAKQISAVETGRWQGPFPSGFGLHFVFVDERTPGSLPPLDAIRQTVHKEWLNERRLDSEKAFYRKLRDRYEIIVEAPPAKAARSEAKQ